MKTLILAIMIAFGSVKCFSQSLVRENKLWSNTEIGTETGSERKSYWIKFQGDTIITNKTYKKIFKSNDKNHEKWFVLRFIREDSTKKVYESPNPELWGEFLLYDFNLDMGDSIFTLDRYFYVDTIIYSPFGNLKDTLKHIHIGNAIWIEGIGNIMEGILFGAQDFDLVGAFCDLVCYFENDELIYHNPLFETCFPVNAVSAKNPAIETGIKIFPNPANHEITIRTQSGDRIQSIELVGLTGVSILKQAGINKAEYRLYTGSLRKGVYVLTVKTKNELKNQRIIVQ
jgi:hypothetical protein